MPLHDGQGFGRPLDAGAAVALQQFLNGRRRGRKPVFGIVENDRAAGRETRAVEGAAVGEVQAEAAGKGQDQGDHDAEECADEADDQHVAGRHGATSRR
ncbi:hypothetical protein ACFY1J_31095 [Streptomyces sp. NPDC001406]|uniref:hypothetical protein n=1 Tax=Streptomyces sp. NPDC001406 TaxID=3364572 RepID=UPI0036CF4915